MGRPSEKQLKQYEEIGDPKVCHFCDGVAGIHDLTPNKRADDADKDMFQEEWVRAPACIVCYRKIYTANVATGAVRFKVPRGCMTIGQKLALIKGAIVGSTPKTVYGTFLTADFIASDRMVYLPESGNFVFTGSQGPVTVHADEMEHLQGAMALRYFRRPDKDVLHEYELIMGSGYMDLDKADLYFEILELKHEQTHTAHKGSTHGHESHVRPEETGPSYVESGGSTW